MAKVSLLANVALAFYLSVCIWAHELDIFHSWKVLDEESVGESWPSGSSHPPDWR
jgi:hypothetical protein